MQHVKQKNYMKKALVHDWYYTNGGAEKVIHSINNVWDDFEHYSLIDFLSEKERDFILKGKKVYTSFIQKLPTAKSNHRKFLQLFPYAVEQFDLSDYDVIISSSAAVAKGVLANQDQLHICYCHSPMRYAWDLYFDYLKDKKLAFGIKGIYARRVLHKLRAWDINSSNRVNHYVANSNYIAKRIKKIYNRDATVIYPPVDIDDFTLETEKENYYVTASRLVSYKKIDTIVKAFNQMPHKRLKVIGDGPDFKKIKKIAKGNVDIVGALNKEELIKSIQKAKAFVYAANEDFGILPVEAQSCGTPVIAYNKGGLRETVIANQTGVFFNNQTADNIADAVREFEKKEFDYKVIRKNAERFSRDRFESEFKIFVEQKIKEFKIEE